MNISQHPYYYAYKLGHFIQWYTELNTSFFHVGVNLFHIYSLMSKKISEVLQLQNIVV
jgi:hypothetical protein